jgi:hypothetical protein
VETVEEVWTTVIRKAAEARAADPNTAIAILQTQAKTDISSRYHDLINLTPLFTLLIELSPMRDYYIRSKLFQPSALRKKVGTFIGVRHH